MIGTGSRDHPGQHLPADQACPGDQLARLPMHFGLGSMSLRHEPVYLTWIGSSSMHQSFEAQCISTLPLPDKHPKPASPHIIGQGKIGESYYRAGADVCGEGGRA